MNENTHESPPVPHHDEQPTAVLPEQPGSPAAEAPTAETPASPAPAAPAPGPGPSPVPPAGIPYGGYPTAGSTGPATGGALPPGYPPSGSPYQGGYPPPAAGYPPVGGAGWASTPSVPPPPAPTARRLLRSRSDRMLGGVCGGLARYWNTDPVLLRILTVVLTLATGGAFLVGYLIAWIAIPDEPAGSYPQAGPGADQVGFAAGGNPPYADQGPGVPPAPRERSYLGWLIASVALLVAGVLGAIGLLVPATPQFWGIVGGVAVTILGLGLLLGAWYGRARWLVLLAVPLAFLTFGTVAAGNWITDNPNWERWTESDDGFVVGDRRWVVTPDDVSGSPLDYRISAGDAVLDLTGLTALGGAEPGRMGQRVSIDAGVGLGQLVVLIPSDMRLDLVAEVDAGQLRVPGRAALEGTNLSLDTTVEPLAERGPAYIVTLDAAMGVGNLEVRREAA